MRNPDFHAEIKWSLIKSQNDLNAACYFLTIQFSVLIDHILVQEKEIASSLRQPANHTSDNQLIRLPEVPKKFEALPFTYGQYVVIELADKLYNFVTVCFCVSPWIFIQVAGNGDQTINPWITKPALYLYTMGNPLTRNWYKRWQIFSTVKKLKCFWNIRPEVSEKWILSVLTSHQRNWDKLNVYFSIRLTKTPSFTNY